LHAPIPSDETNKLTFRSDKLVEHSTHNPRVRILPLNPVGVGREHCEKKQFDTRYLIFSSSHIINKTNKLAFVSYKLVEHSTHNSKKPGSFEEDIKRSY
jgi:hypothetical protein